jgi:pectinesterase
MSSTKAIHALGQVLFVVLAAIAFNPPAVAAEKDMLVVVLVGDSTVTDKAGWGGAIGSHFSDDVKIVNMARGGRSSKSYINEGHLKRALAKKPDYVFIQFGHNDCPGKGPKRETDPSTTYVKYMKIYVTKARSIGAKPILVTSVTRRRLGKDGKIHSSLTPYAASVRRIGEEMRVPVIDLHKSSIGLFESLGNAGCDRLQPKGDHTHFNAEGAKAIAKLVAEEIPQAVPELAKHMKDQAPTTNTDTSKPGD